MKLLLILSLLYVAYGEIFVKMEVFAGSRNPVWTISSSEYEELCEMAVCEDKFLSNDILGYRGFTVQNKHIVTGIAANKKAEYFLLRTAPTTIPGYDEVMKHAISRIEALDRKVNYDDEVIPFAGDFSDHVVIKGPDNVTDYDPGKWNKYPIQGENNCYNYGNDIRTDTFAQPGRGTGQKWKENSCDDITAAAVRDGLVQYTDDPLGDKQPDVGHFIALVMWDGVNFHWLKKDLNTFWSHKPGGTPVKNRDSSGNPIPDPSKADMSPYRRFCGYFIGVPSKVTIE